MDPARDGSRCTLGREAKESCNFREKGYRFFFFSREESRIPVHVVFSEGEAKSWLEPTLELARNHRYNQQQLKEIESLIESHYHELLRAW